LKTIQKAVSLPFIHQRYGAAVRQRFRAAGNIQELSAKSISIPRIAFEGKPTTNEKTQSAGAEHFRGT
jgi:hypothetical protein